MVLPTSSLSSAIHADGISRLIQLRCPEFYSSGIPHKLFVGFRPLLVREFLPREIAYLTVQIVHAFATRRSTFLASLVWRDKPFCVIPATPLQALFSDASEIPSILEELDGSKSRSTSEAVSVAWHAINGFDRVLKGLIRWYKETSAAYGGHLWWSKLKGEETHFWFPSIAVANSLTHFWAFWIMCVVNIRQLRADYPPLKERGVQVDGQSPESQQLSDRVVEMAIWILQSMEYLTQDEMKLFGVASACLPFPDSM